MTTLSDTSGNQKANDSPSVSGKFVNVLIIGTDLSFAKLVQNALNTLQTTQPDTNYRVFPGISKEKILEYIDKYQLHSVLIEEETFDITPEQYLKDFRELLKKTSSNKEVPVIMVCSKTDLSKTRSAVGAGYKDLIVKPLDQSLFLQKMNLYNKDIVLSDDSLLFSMDTAKEIDIGFYFKTKSISEYEMKITSVSNVEIGTIVTVYAKFLEETVAAIVREVTKGQDGGYTITVMFIGCTPAQTQSIRKFIRTEYAEEKQAS